MEPIKITRDNFEVEILCSDKPVLLGGGVGVPPMYNLAKKLRAQGKEVQVILGFLTVWIRSPMPRFSMIFSRLCRTLFSYPV